MEIIYCCYGGSHSSPVAAAIHLEKLDPEKTPAAAEIRNLAYFDQVNSSERGKVMFVGIDRFGNRIYICGRGNERLGIEQGIKSGVLLAKGDTNQLVFINTLEAINLLMRIGGFLSRKLKWIWIGRPLVILGTRIAYPKLVQIVKTVQKTHGYKEEKR